MIACIAGVSFSLFSRLQNSLYFSVNSSTRGSQIKGLERGWQKRARLGRDVIFSLASHGRLRLARKTLTSRFTDFFTDFEKKNPTVLQSTFFRRTKAFQAGSEPGAPSSDACVRLYSLGALASTTATAAKTPLEFAFFQTLSSLLQFDENVICRRNSLD